MSGCTTRQRYNKKYNKIEKWGSMHLGDGTVSPSRWFRHMCREETIKHL
jgi:hypothetical protein